MYVLTVCGGRTTAVLVQVQVYTRTGSLAEGERATVLEYSTGTRVLGRVVLNGTYYNGIFGRLLICTPYVCRNRQGILVPGCASANIAYRARL